MLKLALLLIFFTLSLQGHIYTWELQVEYPNAMFTKLFRIFFQLESGLPDDAFIEVRFPFTLAINTFPTGLLRDVPTKQAIKTVTAGTLSGLKNTYFFNFGFSLEANH